MIHGAGAASSLGWRGRRNPGVLRWQRNSMLEKQPPQAIVFFLEALTPRQHRLELCLKILAPHRDCSLPSLPPRSADNCVEQNQCLP